MIDWLHSFISTIIANLNVLGYLVSVSFIGGSLVKLVISIIMVAWFMTRIL